MTGRAVSGGRRADEAGMGADAGEARRPRLLMVAEAASAHTARWARYFADAGFAVTVASSSPSAGDTSGFDLVRFPPAGAWWTRLPRVRLGGGWQRWVAGWPSWQAMLQRVKPDLVHVHFVSGEARDYFYYRACRRLVVSTYGSDVVFDPAAPPSRATTRRIRSLLRQASTVSATSRFLEAETRRFVPSGRPIAVVPCGVDCRRFVPRTRTAERTDRLVFGFAKHLHAKYGPDVLLDAFAAVVARHPHVRLVLAGDGPLASSLRQQAAALGVTAQLELAGRVDPPDMPSFLQRVDVFVMPSVVQESFGVAALEASACALPVVAPAVGGVPEVGLNGHTGILVPPRDAVALANACIELIEHPARRHAMGEAGRRFVMSRYDWNETASAMRDLYSSLLAH